jgi:hypothetical protein
MPDLQQLLVLAFALVPGFIAAETQAFVALRRSTPSSEKALLAVAYSAMLYFATTIGQWGPQYTTAFQSLAGGDGVAIVDQALLFRYLLLLGTAIALGLLVGRSLASGLLRRLIVALSQRNVLASTWVEFFHDRSASGFWMELRDGRRIAGVVSAASDNTQEQYVVLGWPKWVAPDGALTPMRLEALLIDTRDCVLTGELLSEDLPHSGATP